ncbi:PucR family transcriptional regulator [Rhodococcus sp. NPDC127530]|uniref:PucR family transcriptional regulator n=1 Tax=Rhodococcus sp. NPDC127530 TaxID=3345397 RepID=UPI00363C5CB8
MKFTAGSQPEGPADVDARITEVARALFTHLAEISDSFHKEVENSIPELVAEPALVELLGSTLQGNIELFLEYVKGTVALEEIVLPAASMVHARRVAQREISSVALLRAYRIAQRRVASHALQEISWTETDPAVAYAAAQRFHEMTFAYIDYLSEQVVAEYEAERERWVTNRNTVRTAMLASILAGDAPEIGVAEPALGYRLQHGHVGAVLWDSVSPESADSLQRLERALVAIAGTVSKHARPLFVPSDQSQAWGWIATGSHGTDIDDTAIESVLAGDRDFRTIRVAFGRAGTGIDGFRTTHLEAIRAFGVASADDAAGRKVTSFAQAGVRVASLLSDDIVGAKALVPDALGELAADGEYAERLRETLSVFFEESMGYSAVATRLHMHRNTVRYRIDKATEARGRPLDVDAVELQLALLLCRWLGRSVLRVDG